MGLAKVLEILEKTAERQLCDATNVCAKCGAMAVTSKCSRCLRVCYYNKQCQEKHWATQEDLQYSHAAGSGSGAAEGQKYSAL